LPVPLPKQISEGIDPGGVRLSIGLEDANDLIRDLGRPVTKRCWPTEKFKLFTFRRRIRSTRSGPSRSAGNAADAFFVHVAGAWMRTGFVRKTSRGLMIIRSINGRPGSLLRRCGL